MQEKSCAFCGTQNERLLELYPGNRVMDRQPFCGLCIDLGACEVPFQHGEQQVRSMQALAGQLIQKLRETGWQSTSLVEARPKS